MTHTLIPFTLQYDESHETVRVVRAARQFAEAQESLQPMTREEWDAIQVRHRQGDSLKAKEQTVGLRQGIGYSCGNLRGLVSHVRQGCCHRKEELLR